jgi:hypothetical protein
MLTRQNRKGNVEASSPKFCPPPGRGANFSHYYPISSITQTIVRIDEATEDNDNQYVDGIMFGADHIKPGNGMLLDTIRTLKRLLIKVRQIWKMELEYSLKPPCYLLKDTAPYITKPYRPTHNVDAYHSNT